MNQPETRHYPTTCTSAFCDRHICTGCPHLPQLEEFKKWVARTNAQPADKIWSPNIYIATPQEEPKPCSN